MVACDELPLAVFFRRHTFGKCLGWLVIALSWAWACGGTLALGQEAALHPQPANERELLSLYGIDSSQLEQFHDSEPLGKSDEEILVRLLYRFPRFSPRLLERWSEDESTAWQAWMQNPSEHRTRAARLKGNVRWVEKVKLLPELAERVGFVEYFRVTMELMDSPYRAILAARRVPEDWPWGVELNEPSGALALFLKVGSDDEPSAGFPPLVFATDRVAWYPNQPKTVAGATPSQVFLAGLGVDIGLLEEERQQNRQPIQAEDRESFYQMIAAAKRSSAATFAAQARQPLPLARLLQEPGQHHGELSLVAGQARRVTRIRIDEPDLRERFQLDHYYQIDLFVPLKNQIVRLGKSPDKNAAPVFENSFPVTVCVARVPPELEDESSWPVNIQVPASFFKLWAYRSEYVASFDKDQRQISPMLIGVEPVVVSSERIDLSLGAGLAVVIVILFAGMWLALLWGSRRRRSVVRDRD